MLLNRFERYSTLSTNKTANGMADATKKTLSVYIKQYSEYAKEYNYNTFMDYLYHVNISHNSKALLANSIGRFLWIESYITQEEFSKLKHSYKFQHRVWSEQHISNDMLDTVIHEIEINSRNEFIKNRNLLLIALFAFTSLRVSQVSSIKRQGLIFTQNTCILSIDAKKVNSNDLARQKRQIKLNLETKINKFVLKELFDRYLPYQKGDYLFCTESGSQYSERSIQMMVKAISDKHNLNITPHSFRHEQITRTTNKHGLHIAAILAGHKSITTTMKYVNPEHIDIGNAYNNWE